LLSNKFSRIFFFSLLFHPLKYAVHDENGGVGGGGSGDNDCGNSGNSSI